MQYMRAVKRQANLAFFSPSQQELSDPAITPVYACRG